MLPAMDTTMTAADAISATLPSGYRARDFRDSDREPWTEERNAQVHVLQRGTEFVREPAMGDDDDADHLDPWVTATWRKAAIFVRSGAPRKCVPSILLGNIAACPQERHFEL